MLNDIDTAAANVDSPVAPHDINHWPVYINFFLLNNCRLPALAESSNKTFWAKISFFETRLKEKPDSTHPLWRKIPSKGM